MLGSLVRGVAVLWGGLAHGVGTAARAIGHGARDLDPALRRDGAGLFVLGLAVVIAAEFWFGLPGTFGHVVHVGVSTIVGWLATSAPLLLGVMAWRTLRHPDHNGPAGRQVVGWGAILFGLLGLVNIAKGLPLTDQPERLREAGGILGYLSSSILADLVTVYAAVPLLVLLLLFGILVVVGIPLHELVDRARIATARLTAEPEAIEGTVLDDDLDYGVDEAYETPSSRSAAPTGRRSARARRGAARPSARRSPSPRWSTSTTSTTTTRRPLTTGTATPTPSRPR